MSSGSLEIVTSSSAINGCWDLGRGYNVAATSCRAPVGFPQCQQYEYLDSITELQREHVIIDEPSLVTAFGEVCCCVGSADCGVLISLGSSAPTRGNALLSVAAGKTVVLVGFRRISAATVLDDSTGLEGRGGV